MKGDPVPDEDHVARYVGRSLFQDGRVDGNAFMRKRHQGRVERSPSVHWLEALGDKLTDQMVEVRLRSRLTPRPTAVFARLNVGETRTYVVENDPNNFQIGFMQDPLDAAPPDHPLADPSHALIEGLPHPDDTPEAEAIGDLISQTVLDTFPATAPAE